MTDDLNNILETRTESANTPTESTPSLPKTIPISTESLGFLRFIGWATAVLGIIFGIIILVNAPKGPSDIALQFDSDELPVQIQMVTRLTYLSVGWAQIIGGIVIGVLLNVVAGIGRAVLDIWKAQHPK